MTGGARTDVRRTVGRVLAVVVVALVLAGCAGRADLAPDAARRLQEAVAGVVAAAEAGDTGTALAEASHVRAELERAADAGELSFARYRRIDAALTATEAELTALMSAQDAAGTEETAGPPEDGTATEPAGGSGTAATPAPGPAAGRDSPGKDRGNGVGPHGNRGRGNG